MGVLSLAIANGVGITMIPTGTRTPQSTDFACPDTELGDRVKEYHEMSPREKRSLPVHQVEQIMAHARVCYPCCVLQFGRAPASPMRQAPNSVDGD